MQGEGRADATDARVANDGSNALASKSQRVKVCCAGHRCNMCEGAQRVGEASTERGKSEVKLRMRLRKAQPARPGAALGLHARAWRCSIPCVSNLQVAAGWLRALSRGAAQAALHTPP